MASETLHQLIEQAQRLTSSEQQHLVAHLDKMIHQQEPSKTNRSPWAEIKAKREEILNIAAKYGADNVRIVGNIMQEEIPEEVNFLVDLEPGRSLLDQGGLLMELRELLGYDLYVTVEGGLKGEYRQRVLQEAVAL